jgi:6-phosphogluconolactonase
MRVLFDWSMNTLLHRALYLILACLVTGLIAPRRASAAAARDYWVYFGTYTGAKSKGIYVSRMDATGKLTEPELAATTVNPTFLATDPGQHFLYAANEINDFQGQKAGGVTAFALDATTGKLTELNEQSSGGEGPCHVSVDATGKTVLVANYTGGSVAALPVQADGSLGPAAAFIQHQGSSIVPKRQTGPHGHYILADPSNRFALACDLGLDKVLIYKLDAKKALLTPNDPPFASLKPGAGPRHLAFAPDGKFVYVIDELDCTLTVFRYKPKRGTLTEIQSVSTLPAGQAMKSNYSCAEVVVHPSGKFLYGSNRGHNTIALFRIDQKTGEVTLVEHTPTGGKTPRNFNLDPSGRFLLAANQDSGNVVVFSIDPDTGHLTPTGQQLEMGSPVAIVFVPVR